MIHQIRIQNFKSLRDVTVDLSPVTVFVGRSGTGKTNFTSAIRFLRDYLGGGPSSVAQQFQNCMCATKPSEILEFQVVFSVPELPERFEYALQIRKHNKNVQMEFLKYGEQTIFKQGLSSGSTLIWEVKPRLLPVPDPGPLALGRLPGLEEAVVAHTALTAGIGVYIFPYDVLSSNPSSQDGALGFADKGDNYLGVLKAITRDLQKGIAVKKAIVATLKRINETIVSVELDSHQTPKKAIVAHRFGDNKKLTLDLGQESDGFRRFYAHLLALYQMPPKQTLVFEEPENGIYPGALELLADEFRAAPDADRGQVLLTTHSPALLDHFSVEQIRVVDLVDLETRIGPLAEEQREAIQEQLLHPGELLTVDPARRAE